MNNVPRHLIGDVLFTEEQIRKRVREIGDAISRDYGRRPLVLIGVLRGSFVFLADLIRHITIPHSIDFIAISGYETGNRTEKTGVVKILKDLDENIEGKDVLIVEDIVDTGLTLGYLIRTLKTRNPSSLKICALLDRKVRRIVELPIAYVGFEVPDSFVIGYGLDFKQNFRNLPFIALLK